MPNTMVAFFSLAFSLLPMMVHASILSYDTVYDHSSTPMSTVACSDGLQARGFKTFGSLPHFPFIGAVPAIKGGNSANCGTCWKISYNNGTTTRSVNVLGIDHATHTDYNTALAVMNSLTGGQGVKLGRINVESKRVAASFCGL